VPFGTNITTTSNNEQIQPSIIACCHASQHASFLSQKSRRRRRLVAISLPFVPIATTDSLTTSAFAKVQSAAPADRLDTKYATPFDDTGREATTTDRIGTRMTRAIVACRQYLFRRPLSLIGNGHFWRQCCCCVDCCIEWQQAARTKTAGADILPLLNGRLFVATSTIESPTTELNSMVQDRPVPSQAE
jgi:hypothetical protein